MSRFRAMLAFLTWLALIMLLLSAGCSSPTGLNGAEGNSGVDPGRAPFREADGKAATDSNASAVSPVSDKSAKADSSLPFREPESLPAGTLLTVRLKDAVSAEIPEGRGQFEGILDEPVTVDGNTLVPRGTKVAGRIESVHSLKVTRAGFVRVTLDSIDIAGKDLHLQTSSLFARGNGASPSPALHATTLEKGRRLTFRLTEPAFVVQTTSTNH